MDYIAGQIAGVPTTFHPYQPGSFVGPSFVGRREAWIGEFDVAGKRVRLRMEVLGEVRP